MSSALELEGIVGQSAIMHDLSRLVERVANTKATLMIRGESGTGKELIARAMATESPAGTFTYSLATVFDDGSAPNSGDLILGIQAGDLIDVLYVDTYDAQGGTSDVRLNPGDPITILAGVDGVVSLAPLSLPVGDSFTVNVTDADIPAGGGRGGGHRRALRSVLSSSDRTTY